MTGAHFERIIEWLGSRGVVVYAAVLIVVAGIWGFILLSDQVREGGTDRFDNRANRWVYQHRGPAWVQEAGRDLTAFGGVTGLTLIVGAVMGFLLITRRYRSVLLVFVTTLGGAVIEGGLKHVYDRPRPPLRPPGTFFYSTSFPSGHSMLSAVVYLTLGALLARVTPGRRIKLYLIGMALLLTFLVGLSRVYLGAHYPTDVLAGWTAGLVWAILCWLVARELQRRGAIELDVAAGSK